jgi:hypothetical protein
VGNGKIEGGKGKSWKETVEYTRSYEYVLLCPHGTIPMFRVPEVRFLENVASTAVIVQKSKRILLPSVDHTFLENTA